MNKVYKFLILVFILFSCASIKSDTNQGNELRIVSLSPSNTEILVGLSLGENIIGVDEYSKDVNGVNKSSIVFKYGDPNIEGIIKLKPNILFLSEDTLKEYKFERLKDFGIKIINIKTPDSIDEIYKSIDLIGEKTFKRDESNFMIENLKTFVNEIKGEDRKKNRVYFEISKPPYIYSFGSGTFLNDILENVLNCENILGDFNGWINPSEEFIIKNDPEIIFTSVNLKNTVEEIKKRSGWENISAVKNNRVYYINENFSSRASQFFIEAIYEMRRYIDGL